MKERMNQFIFVLLFFQLMMVNDPSKNSFVVVDGFFFRGIGNLILSARAQFRCNIALRFLRLRRLVSCDCSAKRTFLDGIETSISCEQSSFVDAFCFEDIFCGRGSFDVQYNRRDGLQTAEVCIETEVAGNDIFSIPNFCIEGIADENKRLAFESCSVTMKDTSCTSCTVCASGRAVKFDCSNVELNPGGLISVKGPNIATCLGLNVFGGLL